MAKKYKFEIGIEADIIDKCDDIFEADIEVTEDDYRTMLNAYDEAYCSADEFDTFHECLPSDFQVKISTLAEPFAVAKYGDVGKLANGAIYQIFPPDEVEEEYLNSDACKKADETSDLMKSNCKTQSEYECKILQDCVKDGRWTHFSQAGEFNLFACYRATAGREAYYSMDGQCNGIHVEYCKRYKMADSWMEIRFYGDKSYALSLIDGCLKDCGREPVIKDMDDHYMVTIPAKEDSTDIEILLPVLDRLEADAALQFSNK